MQNRIYWGGEAPKNWKRASPQPQSIPTVPVEFESKQPASTKTRRFVVSTSTVDRSLDSISQDGWDLKAYRRNPVVLASHDASSWPVGKATKIGVESGKLVAEVQFADTFEGRKAQSLVESGFLKSTSVGFRPLEASASTDRERPGGYDFKRQELMEFSLVSVPANPDCLICLSAEEERAERKAELEAMARKFRQEQVALDAKCAATKKPEPEKVSPTLAAIRATREEKRRLSEMGPDEYRKYLDEKRERKEQLKLRAERLRAGIAP